MKTLFLALSLAVAAVPGVSAAATAPASVPGVALEPGNGASWASGLNERGEVLGAHVVGADVHGYVWRKGVVTDLGTLPGGDYSLATAINESGDIAGYSGIYPLGPLHAVLWHHGTITDLGTLGGNSFAAAINDRGMIVGNSQPELHAPQFRAVTWYRGVMTVLPALAGAEYDNPGFVNDRGDVAGYSSLGTGVHAVLWTGGRVVDLGPGRVTALDEQGRVLVDGTDEQGQVSRFLWDHGRRIALPTGVTGLGERGEIFGTYQPSGASSEHGFLWYQDRFVDLGNFVPSAAHGFGPVLGSVPGSGAALWYRGRTTALLPVPDRGDARPMFVNGSGLVVGDTGNDTATAWVVPLR
ncbi:MULTISPECIES: hypothetical protein [Amycolatopsis]|uniref:Extracellular repeat, HAF family n=2 Tax=Amycolatopsis TaxID=1813 RepID=A0ABP9PYB5_9PSEU|nr:hypothetical protein [Amycolatopsis sacchari]SFI78271.1 probable extracellular repeat, HAF family [Amycolatopsis sacchari]